MNVHTDAVLNTVLHNNREAIPFILASVSLDPKSVRLQMEYIKQDIFFFLNGLYIPIAGS